MWRAFCPASVGYIGFVELPFCPWHAAHVCAFASTPAPAAGAGGVCAKAGAAASRIAKRSAFIIDVDKKAATPVPAWPRVWNSGWLRQREHEHAVAALRIDLVVAARRDGDVLLAVHHVRDARRIDARAAVVLPQLLAGARVISLVPAVGFTVEHDVAGSRHHAADQRLRRLVLPGDLAGV